MRTSWLVVVVALAFGSSGATCGSDPDQCSVSPDQDHDLVDAIQCGGTDCDDTDANRFPTNPEVCDRAGHDEDCDPTTFGIRDADADGHPDALCFNVDDGGVVHGGDDCDDNNVAAHPGVPEVCNHLDDDCDSAIDEGVLASLYTDADHDGYGAGSPVQGCYAGPGLSQLGNDCDDTKAGIVPGAMVCLSTAEYAICDANTGMYTVKMLCPSNTTCRAQPNSTGVCI